MHILSDRFKDSTCWVINEDGVIVAHTPCSTWLEVAKNGVPIECLHAPIISPKKLIASKPIRQNSSPQRELIDRESYIDYEMSMAVSRKKNKYKKHHIDRKRFKKSYNSIQICEYCDSDGCVCSLPIRDYKCEYYCNYCGGDTIYIWYFNRVPWKDECEHCNVYNIIRIRFSDTIEYSRNRINVNIVHC